MKKKLLLIYTFYKFIDIQSTKEFKSKLDLILSKMIIRGTILIADEGINGTISGKKTDLDKIIHFIKSHLKIKQLKVKQSKNIFLPFNRIKVRIKKEIVSLGKGNVNVPKNRGKYVEPKDWNKILRDKSIRVVDTRNIYEINIGSFKKSLNPKTNSFREFPESIKNLGIQKKDKLAIYCTGGIRCEKASAYLRQKGYYSVIQLKGGILNYLDYAKKNKITSLWKGECFVFDERVSVNNDLKQGNYTQCHGCRHPLSTKDKKSKFFNKGVSCPHCFKKRSQKQIQSSLSRQKQIYLSEISDKHHPFKKITMNEM